MIELGHKAWKIQADALNHTSYAGSKTDGKLESISNRLGDKNEKLAMALKIEEVTVGLEKLMERNNGDDTESVQEIA